MKKLFALLLVNVLFFAINCGSPVDESGVKTVFSEKPKYDEYVKLTKLFEIPLAADEYIIAVSGGIAIDEEENIYIAAQVFNEISAFDSEGKFQYKFGQKGQGPDDIDSPHNMQYVNGNLYFFQGYEGIKVMTTKGKYVNKYSFATSNYMGLFFGDKNVFFREIQFDGKDHFETLLKRKTLEFEPDTTIYKFSVSRDDLATSNPVVSFRDLEINTFDIVDTPYKYLISRYNTDGEKMMIIGREYTSIPYTQEAVSFHDERNKKSIAEGRVKPLTGKPPVIRRTFSDSKGNTWVVVGETNRDNGIVGFESQVDIFGPEGEWLSSIKIPYSSQMFIKNKRIYIQTPRMDRETEQYLEVYEIEYLK